MYEYTPKFGKWTVFVVSAVDEADVFGVKLYQADAGWALDIVALIGYPFRTVNSGNRLLDKSYKKRRKRLLNQTDSLFLIPNLNFSNIQ